MKRQLIRILLVIVLLLGAAACGSDGVDNGVSSAGITRNQGSNVPDKGPFPEE